MMTLELNAGHAKDKIIRDQEQHFHFAERTEEHMTFCHSTYVCPVLRIRLRS